MKLFLNIFLLFQTSHQLISTSAIDTESVVSGTFTTSPGCNLTCPENIPAWDQGAQCNVTEIGSCKCIYDDPYCFLECADNYDGTGSWMMACAGDGPPDPSGNNNINTSDPETTSDDETFQPFETSLGCDLTCPENIPAWDQGAQCNVTEIGSCKCTYDDPYCFLECADNYDGTGSWMMACAGDGPPDPSGNVNTNTSDPETTSNNDTFQPFETSPGCNLTCPENIPAWDQGAQCNVTEIGSCKCTYDDPYCFLECGEINDGTGSWMMACAGDGPPDPSGNVNTNTLDAGDGPSEAPSEDPSQSPSQSSSSSINVYTISWNMAIIITGLLLG